jgi:hypothetical protein
MAAGTPAGIQVGTAHILVTPQLHPQFGSSLQSILGQQMGQAGRAGGSQLISSISASANAGPVRARFGVVGRNLAAAVIGGFAAAGIAKGIGKVISTGIDETKDFAAGQARLTAGLKSTGNQAGVTVGQLEDLASSIQGYSGQTDDSIVSTEQLLLTFTNIRNEAGKNNDIFTQTTKIAADMSARLGGDASASAIQLGKALNDPIKGVTALQRVGVSFDEGQKATIKTLVQSGNTLGAQKIILAELNKEFGGSAKAVGDTLPGQLNRGKRSFEDLSQSVVQAVLPAFTAIVPKVTAFIQWIGPKLTTGVQAAGRAIGVISDAVKLVVGSFTGAGADVERFSGPVTNGLINAGAIIRRVFDDVKSGAVPILHAMGEAFRDVGTFVTRDVIPSLQNLWSFLAPALIPALRIIGTILVGTVVVGFRALGKILVDVVGPVLRAVTGFLNRHQVAIKAVAIFITGLLIPALTIMAARFVYTRLVMLGVNAALLIVNGALRAMAAVQAIVNAVMNANPFVRIATLIIALGAALIYAYNHSKTFRDIVQAVFHAVASAGQFMWNSVLKPVFDALKFAWQLVMTAFRFYWENYAHPVISAFATAGTWLWNVVLKPTFAAISGAWSGLAAGFSWIYHNVMEPVWGLIQTGIQAIASAFSWVKGAIEKAWSGLVDIFKAPINLTLSVVNTFDRIVDDVTGAIGLGRPLPEHLHLATGGRVPGTGAGDVVPAMLTPGEVVMSVPAVKRYGLDYMLGLNAQKFAGGGQALPITPYAYGSGQHGSYGSFNPLSAVFDTGKWVLSKAEHLLRAGAAAALSASLAPVRALLNPLGNAGAAGWVHGAANHVFDEVVRWVRGKEGSELVGVEGGSGVPTGSAQLIAQRLLPAFGWGADQFPPLQTLWNGESGWRWDALNPSSGAYGIPQSLPADKMASAGADWRTNPETQERWGLGYIKSAYGSPAQALAAWISRDPHWYAHGGEVTPLHGSIPAGVFDRGGILPSGAAAFNFSGRPEGYLDPDESRALKAVLSGATGGGARPGLFAGANVVIGDNVDLEAYDRKNDWQQRQGRAR